ncbi:hypothetical protein EYZ11_013334 [Aspergillus tanneri]|uniref:Uncharacterized protein n=1 Tax=Aspergillus tanneri TaxID=1220188 RepID=A0A4S3IXX1_9EURO|nr:uncharacterized protein ATNIH1004_001852 [Aspergillus tanneri]KAA8641387.1 hypothetical protein ATNIH1004_001852 [Aspergillus tanneri]THC87220.1 hypothetical protein EYZ11_013334 [Aspergillus tanneri]
MATASMKAGPARVEKGDDLYDVFRKSAFAQGHYNVPESRIRDAFDEELRQPGGREALTNILKQWGSYPPSEDLSNESPVDEAVIKLNINEATVDITIGELSLYAKGLFRGGYFGTGQYDLRGFIKYNDTDDLQGTQKAEMFKHDENTLVMNIYAPDNYKKLLAYIVLYRPNFHLTGVKPGRITFSPLTV